jgi:hypothetical protein
VDIGDVEGVGKLPFPSRATMVDDVQFSEAGHGHVSAIGLHRDVLEQGAGLGPAIAAPLELSLARGQGAIDLPRTDLPQLLTHPALSPSRPRAHGSHGGSKALRRTDQGYPAASQICRSACTTAGSDRAARRRRRRGVGPGAGLLSRRRAYLR